MNFFIATCNFNSELVPFQDFRELIAFKKKVNTYVGEMSKIVSNVLENWTYTEEIKAFYNVVGHFVKYCAVCAYTKVSYSRINLKLLCFAIYFYLYITN